MLSVATIRENVSGAWAVMRGQPEGLARLDLSLDGFWRSFAVVILLIPFIVLALASQRELMAASGQAVAPIGTGEIALGLVILLVDWFTFPLIFAALARPFGLGQRYIPFIVARNWAALIISAIAASVHALNLTGVAPPDLVSILLLVTLGVTVRFAYIIARTTLAAPIGVVLPIVFLDLLISVTVWALFDRLAYGG
jgi:hypothetical protein